MKFVKVTDEEGYVLTINAAAVEMIGPEWEGPSSRDLTDPNRADLVSYTNLALISGRSIVVRCTRAELFERLLAASSAVDE